MHLKKCKDEMRRIEGERKHLLINLLKKGYYMHNGAEWILKNMFLIGYKPIKADFPSILDEKSRMFLLQIYH